MRDILHLMAAVDRYLDGSMSGTERNELESRIHADAELRSLVEDQRALREALERRPLRVAVHQAHRAYVLRKWLPWAGGGIVVTLAIAGASVLLRERDSTPIETPIEVVDTLDRTPVDTLERMHRSTTIIPADTIRDTVYMMIKDGKKIRLPGKPEHGASAQHEETSSPMTAADEASRGSWVAVEGEPLTSTSPEFPGGWDAMHRYLDAHLRHPDNGKLPMTGIVVVSFGIAVDGSITDARVDKGLGHGYDEEALRVIRGMPKWQPAQERGKPLKSRMEVPLQFKAPTKVGL